VSRKSQSNARSAGVTGLPRLLNIEFSIDIAELSFAGGAVQMTEDLWAHPKFGATPACSRQ